MKICFPPKYYLFTTITTIIINLICIICFTGVRITAEDSPTDKNTQIAVDFYKLGEQKFNEKKYDEALNLFSKSLEYVPDFMKALVKAAETCECLKDEISALKYYKTCLQILEIKEDLSDEEVKIKDKAEIKIKQIGAFEEALVKCGQEITAELLLLGKETIEELDYLIAADIFNLVLKIDSGITVAEDSLKQVASLEKEEGVSSNVNKELENLYYGLGQKSLAESKFKEAEDYFRKTLVNSENPLPVYMKLAEACEKLNESVKATKYYRLSLKILENKRNPTADETKTLNSVRQKIKQSDKFGKTFAKIKTEGAKKYLAQGNTALNKGYRYFAAQAFMMTLVIDPENQSATKSLESLEKFKVKVDSIGARDNLPELIKQLGDSFSEKRESAHKRLIALGSELIVKYWETLYAKKNTQAVKADFKKLVKALQDAEQDKDQEVKARANQVLLALWERVKPKILFASSTQPHQIWIMDTDGKNKKPLTNTEANNSAATWSRDGQKIIFVSNRKGNQDVYIMDVDGENLRQLTNDAANEGISDCSPGGKKITFSSDKDGSTKVYLMDMDGKNQQKLIDQNNSCVGRWSPDGKKVVYEAADGKQYQLYVMDIADKKTVKLTDSAGDNSNPSWSPDGKKIAFCSDRDGTAGDMLSRRIYVMDADGKNQKMITPVNGNGPSWSPDGKKITFLSWTGGDMGVLVMNADGSGVQVLTRGSNPSWSPVFEELIDCFESEGK
ncbi:MAG: PD40 domain-containing protein [Planctomycetes bacterium]|nr:PD40 domain-containing protein [Planctomycetota bacterium]